LNTDSHLDNLHLSLEAFKEFHHNFVWKAKFRPDATVMIFSCYGKKNFTHALSVTSRIIIKMLRWG
jgi:hypothetical protein